MHITVDAALDITKTYIDDINTMEFMDFAIENNVLEVFMKVDGNVTTIKFYTNGQYDVFCEGNRIDQNVEWRS
jgi:hypothetical protein